MSLRCARFRWVTLLVLLLSLGAKAHAAPPTAAPGSPERARPAGG